MLKNLCCIIFIFCQTQEGIYSQTRIATGAEISIPPLNVIDFTRERNFLVNDGKVYRCVFKNNADYFVEQFDIEQQKYTKLEVVLPAEIVARLSELDSYAFSYTFDLDFLYVGIASTYLRLKLEEGRFVFVDRLEMDSTIKARYFDVHGDQLYIYQTYNHPKDEICYLYTYSWSEKKLLSYSKFDFDFPQCTHIGDGKHYFDFGKSSYLVAQGVNYKIDFYAYDHTKVETIELIDSVHFPLLNKEDMAPFKNQKSVAIRPMNYMNGLVELENKGGRIWGAQFMHDSLLVVNYSIPDSLRGAIFKDDVWRKRRDGWELVETIDLYPAVETEVTTASFWRYFLNNSNAVFHEGKLYYILFNSSEVLFDLPLQELMAYERMHEDQLKIYTVQFNE